MERSSLQKLALIRKLAGTTWGAYSSILIKVYTATVWQTMEYSSTTWGTAAKTNKSRLDQAQNMAMRVILGAMKTTPVHDMGKQSVLSHPRREEVSKSSSKEKSWEGCRSTLYTQTWRSPPKIASRAKAWPTSTKNCPGNTKTLWLRQWSCWQILPGGRIERQTYKCFWVS